MRLNDCPSGDGILLIVLNFDGFGVLDLVRKHLLERGTADGGECTALRRVRQIGDAADIAHDINAVFARFEIFCELDDGMLAHAVHQTVSTRIAQDRRHDVIRPVVVVRKTAQ